LVTTDRFDISATLPEGSQQAQVPGMMQTLLEGRVKLKFHREKKDFPVFGPQVGSGGLKMKEVSAEKEGLASSTKEARSLLRGGRFRLPAVTDSGRRVELDHFLLHRQLAFNAIEEFKGEYRCITADLRNAPSGQSTGPVEVNRPWESYADDQLGLMDHLRIDKFSVMGFCIGGLHLEPSEARTHSHCRSRAGTARRLASGDARPEVRVTFWKSWGATLIAKRTEITLQTSDQFATRMFETDPDFVFTVTRDFVRSCQNPVLILPDEVPAHPYAVAMECPMIAPKAEVSIFPWKEPKERIPLAVRQVHSFLKVASTCLVRARHAERP
jgi:hypothetical protein